MVLGLSQPCLAAELGTILTWKLGKESVIFRESIAATTQGLAATISSSVGEVDSLLLDRQRSTLEWRRRVEAEGTDLKAVRSGGRVSLTGVYKGRAYERSYDFGDQPWYQFQEISYEALFASKAARSGFWTIDRKTLKPSFFLAERMGSSSIEVMGAPVKAVKYSLTVAGVPALVFTSHFWLRLSDGRFLRLEVPPILNLPRSSVELSKETP